jgi:hypothetical protein
MIFIGCDAAVAACGTPHLNQIAAPRATAALTGTGSAGGFELEGNRDMIGALTERFKTFEMRNVEWQRSITRKTPIWFI